MKVEVFVSTNCKFCHQLMSILNNSEINEGVMMRVVVLEKTPMSSIPYKLQSVPTVVVDFKQMYKGEEAFHVIKGITSPKSQSNPEQQEQSPGELETYTFSGNRELQFSDLGGPGHGIRQEGFINLSDAYGGSSGASVPSPQGGIQGQGPSDAGDVVKELIARRAMEVNAPIKRT